MSHYRIAVFHKEYEYFCLLQPYSETNERYYIFEPVSEDELKESWERFHVLNPAWEYQAWIDATYQYDKASGQYGYRYNPNAKYDYYGEVDTLEYFTLREGDTLQEDLYRKSDIDFFSDSLVKSEKALAKQWKQLSKSGDGFYNEKYYLDRYGSEEQYIKEMRRPWIPYAFVTPDGVWHAPGTVGWFAMSDETADKADAYWEEWKEFIENGEDCYITMLDCHI